MILFSNFFRLGIAWLKNLPDLCYKHYIFILFSVDHDHLDHLPRQVVKEDFGFIGQPQKRGAVQPLGLSASSVTITKKARKTAETKSDAKQKWIVQQQQVNL